MTYAKKKCFLSKTSFSWKGKFKRVIGDSRYIRLEMPNSRSMLRFRAFTKSVVGAPHADEQPPNPLGLEDIRATTGILRCLPLWVAKPMIVSDS